MSASLMCGCDPEVGIECRGHAMMITDGSRRPANLIAAYRAGALSLVELNAAGVYFAPKQADAWTSGRLMHAEECQINRTPPAGSPFDGSPFDGFSCNCGGVG